MNKEILAEVQKKLDEYNNRVNELNNLGLIKKYVNILNFKTDEIDVDEWEEALQKELNKYLLERQYLDGLLDGIKLCGCHVSLRYEKLLNNFLPNTYDFINIYPDNLIALVNIV